MLRYRKPGGATANVAGGVLAFLYVGMMLQYAMLLRLWFGVGVLAAWIIVVKMGDTGAYTVGRLIGRHKMAPLISPGKTIEGAVGGLLFSCLALLGRVSMADSPLQPRPATCLRRGGAGSSSGCWSARPACSAIWPSRS